jgi:type IV pilus assembly protein PilQ
MRVAKSLGLKGCLAALIAAGAAWGAPTVASASTDRPAAETLNHVRDVRVRADDEVTDGTLIEITGTKPAAYNVRLAESGRRLLVDLTDSDVASSAPAALTTAVGVVGGVLTQAYSTDSGSMARLAITLDRDAIYRVSQDGTTLRIALAPRTAARPATGGAYPLAPSSPSSSAAGAATAATSAPTTAAAAATSAAPKSAASISSDVRDIRFERAPAAAAGCAPYGCDRVVIDLASIPAYSLATSPSGAPRLQLRATGLPPKLAHTMDVSAYRGALRSVIVSHDDGTGATDLEIDRESDVAGTVSVEGGALVWSFPVPKSNLPPSPISKFFPPGASAVAPAPDDHGDAAPAPKAAPSERTPSDAVRHVVTVAREPELADVPKIETSIHDGDPVVETSGGGAAGFASNPGNVLAQQRYTGRRIDIDLKDADIHNVLRLLADTGHVNVVTADDVSGTITIRMHNVPWDQVLDVVLQAKGLGMVRQGNLIRVAPLAQLQKERELRLAAQKQEYELTPLETRLIPISYAQADEIQARAKELLSPRGSIAVDERTNVLITRDIASNLNYIEELIRSLDTQTAQVLIEARIVEGTSNYLRDVGIQWGGDVTFGPSTGNATGIAFPNSISAAGGASDNSTPTAGVSPFSRTVANPNFAVNLPAAVGTGAGGSLGMSFGSIDNALRLNLRLSAAESSGLVRIVSAPRILVLDNREARINQGTLIPYAQVSALGVQTTFQEAKLQLLVRPHVTAEGSVTMHVKLNRDEPDFNQTAPNGAPTILKREAETDLLVMDGHTAVIGGIYTRNTGRNLNQVPFFGDIPILGILFQRRQANDTRGELIIFITPHIVNRAEALGR